MELFSDKIGKLHLISEPKEYSYIIRSISLKRIDDFFYWANWIYFLLDDLTIDFGTYTLADSASWRKNSMNAS